MIKSIEDDDDDDINESVKIVTKENIGDYTIYDVVLPLIGPGISYPKLETTEFMKELLNRDGLNERAFWNKIKEWGLDTNYRAVMARPTNVKGEWMQYTSDDQRLVEYPEMGVEKVQETSGDKIAWVLSFDLVKSCYATMAARQLLAATPMSRNENMEQSSKDNEMSNFLEDA